MFYNKLRILQICIVAVVFVIACTKQEVPEKANSTPVPDVQEEMTAKIFVDIDTNQLVSPKNGNVISVKVEDGSMYTLYITRIEETMPGIISFSADVENKEVGQAMLILRDGKLTGSVNIYSDGTSYNLAYDSEEQRHFFTTVNPDNRDVLPGSLPISAPTDG